MTIKIPKFNFFPSAKNSLTSDSKFFQRISYDIIFESLIYLKRADRNDFFDTRDYFLYYGRLDNNKESISVLKDKLSNVSDVQNMYALNFVCDAFENLRIEAKAAGDAGEISDEKFFKLKAKKAFTSIDDKYYEHFNKLYKIYLQFSKINNRHKKIINFPTFLQNFITFIDKSAPKTPFLKSSFVSGIDCDINDSGLVIELESSKKDGDEKKMTEYYDVNDFYIFQSIAKKNGFAIDKECPWRLIFNINSENSQKYLNKYELNKNNVYEQCYIKTANLDIENLKNYLLLIYNNIVGFNPVMTVPFVDNNNLQTTQKIYFRNQITPQDLKNIFPDLFWLKLYCYIFFVENRVKLTQKQYDKLINTLIDLNNLSFDLVRKKLNEIADTYEKTNNKNYNFIL